ncbi:MAG: cupredoxin domain-containing protein [Patescibacteria group bacterium]
MRGFILVFGVGMGAALIMAVLWFAVPDNNVDVATTGDAVTVLEDGSQRITILARGGYSPRQVTAKAGIPTTLRMKTNGTYDCSASLVIPSLGYEATLPSTGEKDIQISASQAKGTLDGLCSMGMYSFRISFVN